MYEIKEYSKLLTILSITLDEFKTNNENRKLK